MASLTPLEAAVLVLVARGVQTPRVIAETLRVSGDEVKRVIESLVSRGLLRWEEKRILFLRRRRLVLTELGFEALREAEKILRDTAERIKRAYESMKGVYTRGETAVQREYREVIVEPDAFTLVPLLVMLGLLPASLAALSVTLEDERDVIVVEDEGDSHDESGFSEVSEDTSF